MIALLTFDGIFGCFFQSEKAHAKTVLGDLNSHTENFISHLCLMDYSLIVKITQFNSLMFWIFIQHVAAFYFITGVFVKVPSYVLSPRIILCFFVGEHPINSGLFCGFPT